MNEIRKKLYLGSYEDAENTDYLKSKNVTHILTVHEKKIDKKYQKNFNYKFIKANYETELLSRFKEIVDFIREGVAAGGVLVHCQLGMSRSAAAVMAYVMSEDGCGAPEALERVRARRSIVRPDDSLLTQLRLFGVMKHDLDESLAIYRHYKNYRALSQHDCAKMILAAAATEDGKAYYACKGCHKPLFTADNFGFHLNYMDDIDMYLSEYFEVTEDCDEDIARLCETGSMYIEPMEWMSLVQGSQHDLFCDQCNHKVGHYCLAGEMCLCRKWVYPAIFIDKNEVYFHE